MTKCILSRYVEDLANLGITPNVTLLQEICLDCANLYKYEQYHLKKTKSSSDDYWVIDLPILNHNMTSNSMQFSNWMLNVESTLNKATSFDGLNPFSYMVRKSDGYIYRV